MFHVSCFMFHVSCFMSHVSCLMFHVSCFKSHISNIFNTSHCRASKISLINPNTIAFISLKYIQVVGFINFLPRFKNFFPNVDACNPEVSTLSLTLETLLLID